jgi:long-chain-fatty-acid--CoA ligase ACSBG
MQEAAKSTTGIKEMISTWAKGEAAAYWAAQEHGSKTQSPLMYFLAKALLHKVKVALGFDRCESFLVGAAPTEAKIFEYFKSVDIPIMDIFGQSENSGPHSVNTLKAHKTGTVGRPILGTENKIEKETGELCCQGRHVFAGYMGMEDKTKEAIDLEGWLHTGDIAKMDEDNDPRIPGASGFITITGRIKELIITAGGENIPPVLIEEQLKNALPAVSNAIVIGDKRKFLSVLFSLTVEVDDEGVPTNKLTGVARDTSKQIGSDATTTDEARECPKWQAYFDEGVKKANGKATSRAQNVAKWSLLATDFSEKGGELTPTLKLKRAVAADKYTDIIESMYA